MPARDRPDPIDKLWLIEQFNRLHAEHVVILQRIAQLEIPPEVTPDSPVIPRLAEAIKENIRLSRSAEVTLPDQPTK